jgi:ABC-2 type transport system permease protein
MAMPAWMQTASNFSPAKWAVLALEGAIWRDFTALEMLMPCAVGFGAGVAMFAAGWMIFRRADR